MPINPGEEKSSKIYVENISEEALDINVEFSDFFLDDDGKYIFPSDEDHSARERYKLFFMKDWLQASKTNFSLNKDQNEVVDISVAVPQEANLGGHYGAVFFRTNCRLEEDKAVVSTDKSRVCVSARPGVLFLIQVEGEAVKSGKLKKAEIPRISFADKENLKIELENTGNSHFKPEGTVLAKSLAGQEIFRLDIKDKTLLPKTSRSFAGVLEKRDLFGVYKILGSVKDGDGKEIQFSKWIFLVPWREILVILALAGFWWWFLEKFRVSKKKMS